MLPEAEKAFEELLGEDFLTLDDASYSWISKHIDYFVSESRGNQRVEELSLYLYTFNSHNDEGFWDKVGQALGNLQVLETIIYVTPENRYRVATDNDDDDDEDQDEDDEDEEDAPISDSEIIARILSHVRNKITLQVASDDSVWRAEESRSFAEVIHGHPTITCFEDGGMFPFEVLDALYSALATLPALESIKLSNCCLRRIRIEDTTLENPESLTELLRAPSLRSVCFDSFFFTGDLCRAAANAFLEGTAVTKLEFAECIFSSEESTAIMANSLSRNTSVTCINVMPPCQEPLYNALAAVLMSNSTLQQLNLGRGMSPRRFSLGPDINAHISPVISALGQNSGLKNLIVDVPYSMDESLCIAMQNGLGMNETLESLELHRVSLCDDNAELWCRALSFLRTNKTLKSLVVDADHGVTESCLSTFRIDFVAMLQENVSLESLSILFIHAVKAEEYVVLIAALQQNRALKTLHFHRHGMLLIGDYERLQLNDEEDKRMAALLKKNYALESLPDIDLEIEASDVVTILRLNAAGRRYLIEDGSSVSKGVKVLSRVSSDINSVFFHLLENPRLCYRSAVEAASDSADNGGSTSLVNHIEKREHDRAQVEGKESRRRLT
jgi:hypothetical protein